MTCFVRSPRDLAREDLFRFHRLHAAGRCAEAQEIARRYGVGELAPKDASSAIEAASHDEVPPNERRMEGSDE